jgi:hypothetical protein
MRMVSNGLAANSGFAKINGWRKRSAFLRSRQKENDKVTVRDKGKKKIASVAIKQNSNERKKKRTGHAVVAILKEGYFSSRQSALTVLAAAGGTYRTPWSWDPELPGLNLASHISPFLSPRISFHPRPELLPLPLPLLMLEEAVL